jgi:hypothetical protein
MDRTTTAGSGAPADRPEYLYEIDDPVEAAAWEKIRRAIADGSMVLDPAEDEKQQAPPRAE